MSSQLIVGFIEVAFDGRVLDGSVHPFDLAVGPGVLGLGEPMIDIVEGAGVFEGMRVEELPIGDHLFDLSRRPCFASGVGEVGPPGPAKWAERAAKSWIEPLATPLRSPPHRRLLTNRALELNKIVRLQLLHAGDFLPRDTNRFAAQWQRHDRLPKTSRLLKL
jgi:hypothetical protein